MGLPSSCAAVLYRPVMPATVTIRHCVLLIAGHTALQSSFEADEGEMWLSAESSVKRPLLLRSPRQRSGSGSAVASPIAHRDGSTGLSEDAGPAANGSAAAGVDGDPGSVQQQAATGSDAVETQVGRLSQVQLFRGHSMVLHSSGSCYAFWSVDASAGLYWCRVTQFQRICNQ